MTTYSAAHPPWLIRSTANTGAKPANKINAVCHSADVIRRGRWPGRNLYILMTRSGMAFG
jgi:hypothetical protein